MSDNDSCALMVRVEAGRLSAYCIGNTHIEYPDTFLVSGYTSIESKMLPKTGGVPFVFHQSFNLTN